MTRTEPVVQDALGWDTVNWAEALRFWSSATAHGPGSRALEIGAGGENGGISLWLAARGYDVVCSSLDGPPPRMCDLHQAHGVTGSVRYEQLDILSSTHLEEFDVVVSKSVLGHVGSRGRSDLEQQAILRIHRALRPGGEFWFAENAAATRLHALARRRLGAGRWDWHYLRLDEVPGLLAPFASAEWTTFGTAGALGRTERQRRALGHLDQAVLDRVVPPAWRYVVAGIARKSGLRSAR